MTDIIVDQPLISYYANMNDAQDCLSSDEGSNLYDVVREGKKNKFVCKIQDCKKVFRFKSEIERHVSAHSETRPFKCTFPGCQRNFKRGDALENHVRGQHTGEAPLTCTFPGCNLTFTTSAKLRYHTLLHSEEKPYKCSILNCGRSFVTYSQLKQHERSTLVHRKLEKNSDRKTSAGDNESVKSSESEDKMINMTETPVKKIRSEPAYNNINNSYENYFAPLMAKQMPWQAVYSKNFESQEIVHEMQNDSECYNDQVLLEGVLSENEVLKKELEDSTNLLNIMKNQINQVKMMMPEDIQNFMMAQYNASLLKVEPCTKEVDSYFTETDKNLDTFLADNFLPGTEFYDDDVTCKELDLLKEINFENFSFFPLSK